MREVIVFDLETNGVKECSVLSISAIKLGINMESLEVKEVEKFNRYYYRNVGESVNIGAIEVNGLTDEKITELRNGSEYSKYFNEDTDFELFCKGVNHFIAHNIEFDSKFLNVGNINKFCTMIENVENLRLEGKYGRYKWPKLNETARYYDIEVEESNTHKSDYDTYLCKEIFIKMLKDEKNNQNVISFLEIG